MEKGCRKDACEKWDVEKCDFFRDPDLLYLNFLDIQKLHM